MLERLNAIFDFALFRPDLAQARPRSEGGKGGRPPFYLVFMFNVVILQANHSLSHERGEFLIKDRLSPHPEPVEGHGIPRPAAVQPSAERQHDLDVPRGAHQAQIDGQPAIQVLFSAYDAALRNAGFLAMGGQIEDATVVAAPKRHNTDTKKAELKAGRVPDVRKAKPAKLAQKNQDAR